MRKGNDQTAIEHKAKRISNLFTNFSFDIMTHHTLELWILLNQKFLFRFINNVQWHWMIYSYLQLISFKWKMWYERDFVQTNKTLANKLKQPKANNIKTIETNLMIFQRFVQNMVFFSLIFSIIIFTNLDS